MTVDINEKPEAILLLNPVINYLSMTVYCCVIRKTGLDFNVDFLEYLNCKYSLFVDAVSLLSLGEIENLDQMMYNKIGRMQASFPSLVKAQEELKDHNLYFYDMSQKKYKWIKLENE